jgi:serine/threonine protein kinase
VLGKGTFGTVWLEVLRSGKASGREVRAVKRIQKKSMRDKRELAAMTDFSRRKYLHTGSFVEFFGWFEDSENIYIAMEYFPHGTLSDYIGQGIPENEVRKITGQLLVGLALMHEHDYTHRDLKPDNVFIDTPGPEWSVKIGDFGVSKYVNKGMTALRTGTGTPLYEAPEIQGDVIQENEEEYEEYTNIVDMWSLSCVVFEMSARTVLFPRWPLDYKKLCWGLWYPDKPHTISQKGWDFITKLLVPDPAGRLSAVAALKHEWITSRDPQPLTGEVVQGPAAAAPPPKKGPGLDRVRQSGSSGKVQAANDYDNDALTALSAKPPQVISSSGEHGDGNLSASLQRRTVIRRISHSNNRDNVSADDTHQRQPAPPKAEPLPNKVVSLG